MLYSKKCRNCHKFHHLDKVCLVSGKANVYELDTDSDEKALAEINESNKSVVM